jgi:hypothetical protein
VQYGLCHSDTPTTVCPSARAAQGALGEALGVGQTRVARIEGNPTAVSVEQLIEVLGALGVQLVLRDLTVQRRAGGQEPKAARIAPKRRQAGGDW